MDDFMQDPWLPGSIPTGGTTDPGVFSPGSTDWTQVLLTGISTYGNVEVAKAAAQSHMPINYRAPGIYGRPAGYVSSGGGGLLPLLLIGAVLFIALKD